MDSKANSETDSKLMSETDSEAGSPVPVKANTKAEFWRGIKASVPIVLGALPCGLVLGAQAAQKGMLPWQVVCMTGLNFAGGSEFAAIELWSSPPHALLVVAITLLINSRHLFMGAALVPYLGHLPKRRILPALFLMCDESWAMGYADARKHSDHGMRRAFSMPYYLGLSASMYVVWSSSAGLGAVIGAYVGDINAYGFDMALPALFLVLIAGMWKGVRAALPWLVSLLAGSLSCVLVPGAWYVMVGTLAGLIAAWFLAPKGGRS